MKKQRIFTLIAVALVALLFSAGPVVADVEENPLVETFEGTRCRCDTSGATITYPDGRMKIKGQEALWSIDVDNVLVTGNWWNDMMVNWVFVSDGMLHGKFEIFPDALCDGDMYTFDNKCLDYCDGEYLGYWEGTWLLYFKDGSAQFLRGQGKGKGELERYGLKFDIENPNPVPGVNCEVGGYQIFDGYIITPPSAD